MNISNSSIRVLDLMPASAKTANGRVIMKALKSTP
jgi:hypothetical protein